MITFFVPGQPVAKGRARSTKTGHHYTPAKTRAYESLVRAEAVRAMRGKPPADCPVALELVFQMQIPVSWPAWKNSAAFAGTIAPTTKPDASNTVKSVEDALNGIAWVDDCQITQLTVKKEYSIQPGVLISVMRLDKYPAQISKRFRA
jgi:Holliday junction resolvase RusA-like endonuclease